MALQTLVDISEIGGFTVVHMDRLRKQFPERFNASGAMDYPWFETHIRPNNFIYARHDVNSLSFTLQNGPVGYNGVNGCQVDTLIEAAKIILVGLNKFVPSYETGLAITKLDSALHWLEHRRKDRASRGVEGTNQP